MLQQQTQSPGWRVLNRDVIKYIAVTAMLLNHIANIFLVPGTLGYEVLVDIGYFTAITMCYFLVEGFRYTHSRKQYALRLFTLLFRWSGQDQKRLRFSFALSAALFGWLNYTSSVWLYPTAQCLLMACGSMAGIAASGFVILYLYNGQRAARGKKFSHWFFYLFYPVHLLVLGVIRVMG